MNRPAKSIVICQEPCGREEKRKKISNTVSTNPRIAYSDLFLIKYPFIKKNNIDKKKNTTIRLYIKP
jgi:hypothetical protein